MMMPVVVVATIFMLLANPAAAAQAGPGQVAESGAGPDTGLSIERRDAAREAADERIRDDGAREHARERDRENRDAVRGRAGQQDASQRGREQEAQRREETRERGAAIQQESVDRRENQAQAAKEAQDAARERVGPVRSYPGPGPGEHAPERH
ncbi:MAG: hypothetical protein LAT61_02485 [Alcanivorax sp.]|nr:hypothetical protein [Alcanivorax sp.]